MGSQLYNLVKHYICDATIFALFHACLAVWFILAWYSYRQKLLRTKLSLNEEPSNSNIWAEIEATIARSAVDGREADLQGIGESIAGQVKHYPERLRPLINAFVVVGLMGTLYSLFGLGTKMEKQEDLTPILGNMGVAFSASLIGVTLALISSIFFLRHLQNLAAQVINGIGPKLRSLSASYPPRKPEQSLDQIADRMEKSTNAIKISLDLLREREEVLLTEFQTKTTNIISDLADTVTKSQERAERTAESIRAAVASSMSELNRRFLEISESWRTELEQTLHSNEEAARNLNSSAESLNRSTHDVAVSLQSVCDSLERTKDLARIVGEVERGTQQYLQSTNDQHEIYLQKTRDLHILYSVHLSNTVSDLKQFPSDLYTMLDSRNQENARNVGQLVSEWQKQIEGTSRELATNVSRIVDGLNPLQEFVAPGGTLARAVDRLGVVLAGLTEWFELHPQTDPSLQLNEIKEVVRQLENAFRAGFSANPTNQYHPTEKSNGLSSLEVSIRDIYKLLEDWIARIEAGRRSQAQSLAVDTQQIVSELRQMSTQVVDLAQAVDRLRTEVIKSTEPPAKPKRSLFRTFLGLRRRKAPGESAPVNIEGDEK